jgi:hypothetical protein
MRFRVFIDSSVIAAVSYAPGSTESVLDVEFTSGATYRYFDVPAPVVYDFLAADSKGSFFNRCIRSRYPCAKLVAVAVGDCG